MYIKPVIFYTGYSNEHLYNQLFKCGNADDFLQSYTKNVSETVSRLACRRALSGDKGIDDDAKVEYEVKFRAGDVNVDRVQQNWREFGSLALGKYYFECMLKHYRVVQLCAAQSDVCFVHSMETVKY